MCRSSPVLGLVGVGLDAQRRGKSQARGGAKPVLERVVSLTPGPAVRDAFVGPKPLGAHQLPVGVVVGAWR